MTSPSFDWAGWQLENALVHDAGGRTVWILDKHMTPIMRVPRFFPGAKYGAPVNGPGACRFEVPADDPVAPLLLELEAVGGGGDPDRLLHEGYWIVVRTKHVKKFYRLAELELTSNDGDDRVAILGEGGWEHINHLSFWSNPGSPLLAQLKWADVQFGDALRVIKRYLWRNLARHFQPSVLTKWDPWTPTTWAEVDETLWPIMVSPIIASTTTEWTVLQSRFSMAGDLTKPTLDAAGLQLTVDLWLPGDEQPAPSHVTLTKPTIWLDVVPRSFDSASTGRVGDVIRGVRSMIAADDTTRAIVLDDNAFTGDNPEAWCVWSADHMRGTSSRVVVRKSTDSHVIVGGRSPQIVNGLISAGSSALWTGIATAGAMLFPPLAPLIMAAGDFAAEMSKNALKDKFFAWSQFSSAPRAAYHGPYRYRELVRPGEGWSLSALQQAFTVLQETSGSVSTEFAVGDGYPYMLGRDFMEGHQAAFRTHGIVFATYVESWEVSVERGGDVVTLGLGDPRLRESPARALANNIDTVRAVVDNVKTVAI